MKAMPKVLSCSHLLLASFIMGWGFQSAAASPALPVFKLAALDGSNHLVVFKSDAPQQARTVNITGTDAPLTGIDVRPANQKLYGLSQNNTLFTIDPSTGVATKISRLTSAFRGAAASGFDFNPQSDRLRLVAATGQNLRVKVEVGAVGIDGVLNYASNDLHSGHRPSVTAAAYTNSVPNARSTILFVIDHERDILIQQEPPNDGILTTVGPLGVDCGPATGFDIITDQRGVDHAFLICGVQLYGLDINTGAALAMGKITAADTAMISLSVLSE
jgi:trimeric autotransporter adhesin